MKSVMKLAAAVSIFCLGTGTAQAGAILDTPILGGSFYTAEDGDVFAEYLGSDAGYFNSLYYLDSLIFDKRTPVGTRVNLGSFEEGDELLFKLRVRQTGLTFHSGGGSNNPDLLPHFQAVTSMISDSYVTRVGVEDLLGGGDRDYNDFMFSLTNVIDPPPGDITAPPADVPEPPVLLLVLSGMLGLLARRRRADASR